MFQTYSKSTHHGQLLQLAAEVCQLLVPVVIKLVKDVSEAARAQARVFIQVLCRHERHVVIHASQKLLLLFAL